MVGIVSHGAYVPRLRLKTSEIAHVWGKDGEQIKDSLGLLEKSVAANDEDAVTMGFEAAKEAVGNIKINPKQIGCLFVGSESHPYAVNPTSTIIGEYLNIGHNYFASDLEFACKAATTGLIMASALITSKKINYGLIVGTDCAQAKPHDPLEYAAASASAAFILGNKEKEIIAEIIDYTSFSSDTPDFWRRDGVAYPSHGGRFTKGPGFLTHVLSAGSNLLKQKKMKPADFSYCIFHMPNCKYPKEAAKYLGFTQEQLSPSLIVEEIGNPYSASSLLGLISVLNVCKPNQYLFFVSYGSGAGADAFIFKTTNHLSRWQKKGNQLKKIIKEKQYISYLSYLKARGVI